ncbi:hypothetical protein ACLOJK_002280 [Asimina triloba]
MDSLRKSFKSHGSYKQVQKPQDEVPREDLPILFEKEGSWRSAGSDRGEVVVKIDGSRDIEVSESSTTTTTTDHLWGPGAGGGRGSSAYRFWQGTSGGGDSMSRHRKPSKDFDFDFLQAASPLDESSAKLIRESSGEHKEMDGVHVDVGSMQEQQQLSPRPWLPPLNKDQLTPQQQKQQAMSKELKVSFQDHSSRGPDRSSSTIRRRYRSSSDDDDDDDDNEEERVEKRSGVFLRSAGEVTRCTSNASFKKNADMLRSRTTKSRLMDPVPPPSTYPPQDEIPKSGKFKSGMLKSGMLKSGLLGTEEDDDDPFFDEDIPDRFSKEHLGTATILEWVSLITILIFFICSILIPYLKRKEVLSLHLWKWEVLVLVLICGRLVSGWVIKIAVFFIERNFLLHRRVLYFVYSVRKSVQNFLWLSMVLIAWRFLLDRKVQIETKNKHLPYITKVLVCLLVASLINLIKTVLVKSLASSFHVNAYFDRIQEALFNQYVIETLSGSPQIEIQNNREEEERVIAELQRLQNAGAKVPPELRAAVLPSKSSRINMSGKIQRTSFVGKSSRASGTMPRGLTDEGIKIEQLSKLNHKNVSAWNMKRLMNIVRHGVLCTLDESIPDATQEYDSAMQIRNEFEAKAAAKKIFINVAKPGCKHIYLLDLMRFMKQDEALKTMGLFEGAKERQKVGKTALKNWVACGCWFKTGSMVHISVLTNFQATDAKASSAFLFLVEVFRERRALSLTLNDTKTAVNKLHQMINVVVVLVTFMFGNTAKMIFEAIIFLFVMHPFDVGDRCEIDGVQDQTATLNESACKLGYRTNGTLMVLLQMVVEEMNIMTTVFLRYDNLKIIYPNSALSTIPIFNFYRSPDMGEAIDLCIHVSTPLEKIPIFKEMMRKFIVDKVEHWYPSPQIVLRDVDEMNKLGVSIWFQHRMNYQNMGERWTRREIVVEEMLRVLRELEIEYRMLPIDVNLRHMPSLTSSRLPSNWTAFARASLSSIIDQQAVSEMESSSSSAKPEDSIPYGGSALKKAKLQSMLSALLHDPVLSDVPQKPSLSDVETLISLELGSAMKISLLKMDGTSFDVAVLNSASVKDLKLAIKKKVEETVQSQMGHRHISWRHIWANFCLAYQNEKLIDDNSLLQDFGIRNNSQEETVLATHFALATADIMITDAELCEGGDFCFVLLIVQ